MIYALEVVTWIYILLVLVGIAAQVATGCIMYYRRGIGPMLATVYAAGQYHRDMVDSLVRPTLLQWGGWGITAAHVALVWVYAPQCFAPLVGASVVLVATSCWVYGPFARHCVRKWEAEQVSH